MGPLASALWGEGPRRRALRAVSTACRVAEGEGVRTVVCLQEDSDMAYFDLVRYSSRLGSAVCSCPERAQGRDARCVPRPWQAALPHSFAPFGGPFSVLQDLTPILERIGERGDVRHVRHRIRCAASSPTSGLSCVLRAAAAGYLRMLCLTRPRLCP
jgi:hypothetical protein